MEKHTEHVSNVLSAFCLHFDVKLICTAYVQSCLYVKYAFKFLIIFNENWKHFNVSHVLIGSAYALCYTPQCDRAFRCCQDIKFRQAINQPDTCYVPRLCAIRFLSCSPISHTWKDECCVTCVMSHTHRNMASNAFCSPRNGGAHTNQLD